MLETLLQRLTKVSVLVDELGLTSEDAYSITLRTSTITIQMDALPLLRVLAQLKVPPMEIQVFPHESRGSTSIHAKFTARGADWVALIDEHELTPFYTMLGSLFTDFRRAKKSKPLVTAP